MIDTLSDLPYEEKRKIVRALVAADDGLALIDDMKQAVCDFKAERIELREVENPDELDREDEPTIWALVCPYCEGILLREEVDVSNLVAVDESTRHTHSHGYSEDTAQVQFYYGSTEDYDGVCYLCDACSHIVRLPEGWTE